MALAQDTDLLLLDEPTTYLDIAHQVEMLDLLADLNRDARHHGGDGAARPQPRGPLRRPPRRMKDGRIVAEGTPAEVVTEETVHDVFGLGSRVIPDPVSRTPLVVPVGRHHVPTPTSKGPHDDHDRHPLAADDPRRGRGGRGRAALADVRPGASWAARCSPTSASTVRSTTSGSSWCSRTTPAPCRRSRARTSPGSPRGSRSRRPSVATCGPTPCARCAGPAPTPGWWSTSCCTSRTARPDPVRRGRPAPRSVTGWWSWRRGVASRSAASSSHRPARGSLLLAADETAVPAVCSILEDLPAEARGVAFLEVPDPGDVQDVDHPVGIEVVWLPRGERAARRAAALVGAGVPRCRIGAPGRAGGRRPGPVGDPGLLVLRRGDRRARDPPRRRTYAGLYAWIAGESGVVTTLRRHLVRELGMDRRQVAFMGYWRRGVAMRS